MAAFSCRTVFGLRQGVWLKGIPPMCRSSGSIGVYVQKKSMHSPSTYSYARRPLKWMSLKGEGNPAPPGGGLQTSQYIGLRNTDYGTLVQLFFGSTGAIMFRKGNITGSKDSENKVKWLGWDGDVKHGFEGKVNFSQWLAPDLMASLERGEGKAISWEGVMEAGYWRLSVGVDPMHQSTSSCIVTNIHSDVKLVLTDTGFLYQTEKGGGLIIVNGEEEDTLPREECIHDAA